MSLLSYKATLSFHESFSCLVFIINSHFFSTYSNLDIPVLIMVAVAKKPAFVRLDATNFSTTPARAIEILGREGGVIIENLVSKELAQQIKTDLKPHFDGDTPDKYGFFPETTQRASGLLGISDACVELACNPLYISVANAMVSSSYTFWRGDHQETVSGKPIISSTVVFRVNPGGRQQVLHRDDKYVKLP